mmetsp:Transcript_34875/g.42059  ORF Transcript_34875/g.42059 Transcript_34875/m.42059 type:complete len:265 (-) Transcript_34875:155-949(-)
MFTTFKVSVIQVQNRQQPIPRGAVSANFNPLGQNLASRTASRSANTKQSFLLTKDNSTSARPPVLKRVDTRFQKGPVCEIIYRRARDKDLASIRKMVLGEKLNPLGLDVKRFVVAVEKKEGGQQEGREKEERSDICGCGQLKPWPCLYDLPDWRGKLVRALRLKPNWQGDLVELSSLVVRSDMRRQGIGRALVEQLMESVDTDTNICLLTTASNVPFYEPLGFTRLQDKDVPRPLKPEVVLGNIVAGIAVGEQIVVLARRSLSS